MLNIEIKVSQQGYVWSPDGRYSRSIQSIFRPKWREICGEFKRISSDFLEEFPPGIFVNPSMTTGVLDPSALVQVAIGPLPMKRSDELTETFFASWQAGIAACLCDFIKAEGFVPPRITASVTFSPKIFTYEQPRVPA